MMESSSSVSDSEFSHGLEFKIVCPDANVVLDISDEAKHTMESLRGWRTKVVSTEPRLKTKKYPVTQFHRRQHPSSRVSSEDTSATLKNIGIQRRAGVAPVSALELRRLRRMEHERSRSSTLATNQFLPKVHSRGHKNRLINSLGVRSSFNELADKDNGYLRHSVDYLKSSRERYSATMCGLVQSLARSEKERDHLGPVQLETKPHNTVRTYGPVHPSLLRPVDIKEWHDVRENELEAYRRYKLIISHSSDFSLATDLKDKAISALTRPLPLPLSSKGHPPRGIPLQRLRPEISRHDRRQLSPQCVKMLSSLNDELKSPEEIESLELEAARRGTQEPARALKSMIERNSMKSTDVKTIPLHPRHEETAATKEMKKRNHDGDVTDKCSRESTRKSTNNASHGDDAARSSVIRSLPSTLAEGNLQRGGGIAVLIDHAQTNNIITEEQSYRFSRMFRQLDTDGGGSLSQDELRDGLAQFSEDRRNRHTWILGTISREMQQRIIYVMRVLDLDGNDEIDEKEFIVAMSLCERIKKMGDADVFDSDAHVEKLYQTIEYYKRLFLLYDADGSGSLCADELLVLLNSAGHLVTSQEVELLINSLDKDGNGEVEFAEFLTYIPFFASMHEHVLNIDEKAINDEDEVDSNDEVN